MDAVVMVGLRRVDGGVCTLRLSEMYLVVLILASVDMFGFTSFLSGSQGPQAQFWCSGTAL